MLSLLSVASPSHKATGECSTVAKEEEKQLEAEQEQVTSNVEEVVYEKL